MIRWLIVWLVAFALRRGIPPADVLAVVTRSWPHKDADWRMAVVNDATMRNLRKAPVA